MIQRWRWFVPVLIEWVSVCEIQQTALSTPGDDFAAELLARRGQVRIHARLLSQHWDDPGIYSNYHHITGLHGAFEQEFQDLLDFLIGAWQRGVETGVAPPILVDGQMQHVGRYILAGYYHEVLHGLGA